MLNHEGCIRALQLFVGQASMRAMSLLLVVLLDWSSINKGNCCFWCSSLAIVCIFVYSCPYWQQYLQDGCAWAHPAMSRSCNNVLLQAGVGNWGHVCRHRLDRRVFNRHESNRLLRFVQMSMSTFHARWRQLRFSDFSSAMVDTVPCNPFWVHLNDLRRGDFEIRPYCSVAAACHAT